MSRILVIEDDAAIRRGLSDNLVGEAYEVLTAADGANGYRLIRDERPDLIVLDLMLPDVSGLDLCRRVRSEGLTTPIVMLTAHGEEAERVHGFDVGADDYVTKPFSLKELLARIRAMLRHRGEWSAERAEIDQDVRRAADVQRRLLPQNSPRVASLDYAACCHPARGIGGDYYDFIDLGGGRLGLLVADVAGKGITAALTVAALHALIRSEAPRFGCRCDELLVKINESLYESLDAARYATLFYAVYDAAARTLTYVNAGHPAPLLIRGDDNTALDSSTPPLGMFPSIAPVRRTMTMRAGDWLVLFSDGVTEAVNDRDEQFGDTRLAEVVRAHRSTRAESMRDAIRAEVNRHAGGRQQSDDLTLLVARVTA